MKVNPGNKWMPDNLINTLEDVNGRIDIDQSGGAIIESVTPDLCDVTMPGGNIFTVDEFGNIQQTV